MAEEVREPEEDFTDQFVLDDANLDDISLDDDSLFADLDSEIRMDGEAEASAEIAPMELDMGGDDGGLDFDAADLEPGSSGEDAPIDLDLGGEDSGLDDLMADGGVTGEGLDDLALPDGDDDGGLDDLMAGGGATGDGLDDLALPDGDDDGGLDAMDLNIPDADDDGELDDLLAGNGEELDDLIPPEPELDPGAEEISLDAAPGDDLDLNLDISTAETPDDSLGLDPDFDDLIPPETDTNGSDFALDDALDAELDDLIPGDNDLLEDESNLDEIIASETVSPPSSGVDLNAFVEEINLEDLGEVVEEATNGNGADNDLDFPLGDEVFSMETLLENESGGESTEFSVPGDADLPSFDDNFGVEDTATEDELDFSLDSQGAQDIPDAGTEDFSLERAFEPAEDLEDDASEEMGFEAHPDVEVSDYDLAFELPDAGEDNADLTMEPPSFGADLDFDSLSLQDEIPGVADAVPTQSGSSDDERGASAFTAVDDVDLSHAGVLDLNLDQLDQPGPAFTNYNPPGAEEGLDIPVGVDMGAASGLTRSQSPGVPYSPPSAATVARETRVSNEVLLAVPHQVHVEMGKVALNGQEILDLHYGSVVALNRNVGEPVELVLGGKAIAQGEIVLINGKNLGVRIVSVNR